MNRTSTFPAAILFGISGLREKFAANRRRFAVPLTVAALLLFIGGGWYSAAMFHDAGMKIDTAAFLVVLALAPVSVLYAGLGLLLMARAAQTRIPLGKATVIASYATLAEVLPLPGGAIVRAGALTAGGASLRKSAMLTFVLAGLWISLAAAGSGLALSGHDSPVASLMLLTGGVGAIFCGALLWRQAGIAIASLTVLHRFSGIALIALRLKLTFHALGVVVALGDTLPFAMANIAGSAASIAPSGLGISEVLAALVAGSVKVVPAAAFLAVGIDRMVCLGASAVAAMAVLRPGPADLGA